MKPQQSQISLKLVLRESQTDEDLYGPMTAKMSVLVKCLKSDSFTTFLLSFSSFMVWARLTKMCTRWSRKNYRSDHFVHTHTNLYIFTINIDLSPLGHWHFEVSTEHKAGEEPD